MPEKFSESNSMRELIAAVAGPKQWSDTRESWLDRAARKSGVNFRQVKALFYGEITDPNHRSARLMRDAAEKRAKELASQFETIAGGMNVTDPDFYRRDILTLISVARELRGQDRAGDDG
jgi:hypothetical protein